LPEEQIGPRPGGVVVLGMHRSGTSAATGVLSRLGLSLCVTGDLLDGDPGNTKGHFESISMMRRNEAMLVEMGRSWWCPPRWGPGYDEDATRVTADPDEARLAFDAVHPRSPFVWKDPRTALTLPFWRRALERDRNLAFVVLLRPALDVAASLHQRDGLRHTHGVALWERYNRHILTNLAGAPAILTRYSDLVEQPSRWCGEVLDFLAGCGIGGRLVPEEELRGFVEPSLRHHSSSRSELLASFASCAVLHDALESSVGAWSCFESPHLPEESPWVEAELTAIGCWQHEPLPRPARPAVTVVVVTDRPRAAAAGVSLAGQLLPFMEGVLVVAGGPDPSADAELASLHPRLAVRAVAAGTPLGAARAAGVAASSAPLIEFRAAFATTSRHWPPELRRAVAAGYAAVSPPVSPAASPNLRHPGAETAGYGLEFASPCGERRWLGRPDDDISTVVLLAGPCFALRRDVLAACGGFDESIGADDLEVHELSVRLWRLGERAAVVRDSPLERPGAVLDLDGSGELDALRYAQDLIRLATMHFSPAALARVVEALAARQGIGEALSSVLTSDAAARRAALLEAEAPFADALGIAGPCLAGAALEATPHATTARVALSLIAAGKGAAAALPALQQLARELPGDSEVLTAASRGEAARRAAGELLLFVRPGAVPGADAARRLLEVASRSSPCAAGPSVLAHGRRTHPRGGLSFLGSLLEARWSPAPRCTSEVSALPGTAVALPRSLFERAGGYDDALEGTGWADVELSLRLWRSGAQCVVVPEAVVAAPGPWWGGGSLHGDDTVFGLLRLAAVHLDADDHAQLIGLVAGWRGFPAAVGRLACSEVGLRRQELDRGELEPARAVLERWYKAGSSPGPARSVSPQ
jgi:GT2 family glycosyltransferase